MNNPIIIAPYNPEWPTLFDQEANRIKKILGNNLVTVHHIGSTAVPNLAAKPIIDMVPVVKDILLVDTVCSGFEKLGYESRGEYGIPFRRFFTKPENPIGYNVHIFEEGNPDIERHLLFRDWMRAHDDDRKAYALLKQQQADLHTNNRQAYVLGKDAFIAEIDARTGFDAIRIVRVLTPAEWGAYHRIRKEQLFDTTRRVYDPNHPCFKEGHHHHFVLYKGRTIVGVAHLHFLSDTNTVLRPFAIDAPYQNKGLGSAFLPLLERWLKHQGRSILLLHANMPARAFYERLGYTPMRFEDTNRALENTIDMGKVL